MYHWKFVHFSQQCYVDIICSKSTINHRSWEDAMDYFKMSCMKKILLFVYCSAPYVCGNLELNPFLLCPNCLKEVSIRVKISSCSRNMCKRSKASISNQSIASQNFISDIPTIPQYCCSQHYSGIGLVSQFPTASLHCANSRCMSQSNYRIVIPCLKQVYRIVSLKLVYKIVVPCLKQVYWIVVPDLKGLYYHVFISNSII